MKIRQGFVSNSSSSSFIVGYGAIDISKYNKLKKFLKKADLDEFDFKIVCVHTEYKNSFNPKTNIGINRLKVPVESFDAFDLLLLLNISNYEGDDEFFNKITYECEYEKANNIDYYPKEQQKIIRVLKDGVFFDKSKPYICTIGALHT